MNLLAHIWPVQGVKDVRIFHRCHRLRRREQEFSRFLANRFNAPLVNAPYEIDAAALDQLVSTRDLVAALEGDVFLPPLKRRQCIDLARRLPDQIRVALLPSRISFDVIVEQDGRPYCWEFHEEQHRELTVTRSRPIYGPKGEEMRVPRFLQRLVRDIWRLQAVPAITVVWCDWFEKHKESYDPLLLPGFREYAIPGLFSFDAFCRAYSATENRYAKNRK